MTVFLDTSFLKALLDSRDDFHHQAIRIFSQCQKQKASLVTTNYIIDEALTLLRARGGLALARKVQRFLAQGAQTLTIIRVTIEDDANAWQWFEKNWSRLSFTDCTSFAIMKRLGIAHAATFDKHFSRAGFTVY